MACVSAILWALLGVVATGDAPLSPTTSTSQPADAMIDEEGFVALFNGRDLSGWRVMAGPEEAFRVRDGLLEITGRGGYPTWLRSERRYENFVLRFEYRLPHYTECGVLLHAPLHGPGSRCGLAIRLIDDSCRGSWTNRSGSIIGAIPAATAPTDKYNCWYPAEVVMDWPRLRVTINGRAVQDVDCTTHPALRDRLRDGYLGLADLGGYVSLRNIRVRELPGTLHWTSLFNGQDLSGWQTIGDGRWSVQDGAIVAENGNGYLLSESGWQDFELLCQVRTSPRANGGIFFRWGTPAVLDRGYEVQLHNNPDSSNPTGSLYSEVPGVAPPTRDNEWFLVQIKARGPRAIVRVNGQTTASSDQLQVIRSGPIGLQIHSNPTTIAYQDIRIRSLDAEEELHAATEPGP